MTGLTYQKRYYICAYATNAKGTSYSSATNFFTSTSSTPNTNASVKEGSIGSTTATMEGKIASDGGDGSEELEISEVGFCWSENTSEPTIDKDSHVKATLDKESKTFTVNLTGLKAYTYYYVRAYAKIRMGWDIVITLLSVPNALHREETIMFHREQLQKCEIKRYGP